MCLYLSLSALHVSDSLVHHQERRFGAVYRNWCKPVRLAVLSIRMCQQRINVVVSNVRKLKFEINGKAPLYEGHLENKERFAIQRYLLIIGKKKNMQVL